ncbi:hypothetical protein ACET3Z_027519 [Daucus carota]
MTKFIGNLPRIYAFCTNGFALQVCRPVLTMINGRATKFDNLKELGLCPLGSYNLCQISNAIYLIRCFPSLRRFLAILVDDKRANPPDLASNLDSVDLKDTSLCQLHTVDVLGVTASNYVFHLVKLLLASAPSLKVMSLHCSGEVIDPGERFKIKQELQGFIDGSFNMNAAGQIVAGVGGVIINQQRACKLVFSGPVDVKSNYEAKAKALMIMMSHLQFNCLVYSQHQISIHHEIAAVLIDIRPGQWTLSWSSSRARKWKNAENGMQHDMQNGVPRSSLSSSFQVLAFRFM